MIYEIQIPNGWIQSLTTIMTIKAVAIDTIRWRIATQLIDVIVLE